MRFFPATNRHGLPRNESAFSHLLVLVLAMVIFYFLLLAVGPAAVVDAMPDVDLGGGISMTPDGQIRITNDFPSGPMRIPEESEYGGITTP